MIRAALKSSFMGRWLLFVAIVGLYLVLAYLIAPGADTLWRLHIADGLLAGQALYRDIIEVNPPLWFWAAIPAAALGGYPALVGINLLATLAGAWLFGALLRMLHETKDQWAAVWGLVAGLLLVSVGEIGQREQAFLLACALWAGLAAVRIEGKAVPAWLAILVTLFAAYGFALKHYFVLVPIAIEALVIWHKRRSWTPFRVETLLLAALAIIYSVAVIYLTPDFLTRILNLVKISYYGFGPLNSGSSVQHHWSLIGKCSLFCIPFLAVALARNRSALIQALLVALAVSIAVIWLQQKGWRYHLIGASGLSIIIMSLLWQATNCASTSRLFGMFFPLGLGVIATVSIVQPSISNVRTNGQPANGILTNFIAQEPKDSRIAILSTAPDNAFFPLARAKRAPWSRYFSMWMLPGLLKTEADPLRNSLRQLELVRVQKEFVADLTCRPPDVIMGEIGYYRNLGPVPVDTVAFLQEDRAFAAWLAMHYRRDANVGRYPIWRLDGIRPQPQNCTMQLKR